MLRIAVIGTGFIGMQHIEAIGRIPNCQLVAVCDRNIEKMERLKNQGICESIYTDYRKLLEKERIDVVHNCTPTNLHFEINKLAIEHGVNIYSEKPLVKNLEEAEEIMRLIQDKEILTAVNYNYRNNLLVQEMHKRVKSGDIGDVLFVQGSYLQDWLMYETDYDWRMDKDIGGKSRALADIGSHCFDIVEYIISARIKKVNARIFRAYDHRKKFEGVGTFSQKHDTDDNYTEVAIDTEDGGVIQVEFENGVIGSFIISQISAGKKNDLTVNISGTRYALEWSQEQSDRLWIGHRDKGNEEIYADAKYVNPELKDFATLPNGHPVGWHDALTNGIKRFYRSVEEEDYSGLKPYATFEDGYHIMRVIDACFESDEKKRWVEIN